MVDVKLMRPDGKGGFEECESNPDDYDEGSGTLTELPDRPCVVHHRYASESGKTGSRWSVDGKLMPEGWSPYVEEPTVTITKTQLRKLVEIAGCTNCYGCGLWWEDRHESGCTFEPDLEELRILSE